MIDRAWNLLHPIDKAFIISSKQRLFTQCYTAVRNEYQQKVLDVAFGKYTIPDYLVVNAEPDESQEAIQERLLQDFYKDDIEYIPNVCLLKDVADVLPRNLRNEERFDEFQAYRNYLELIVKPGLGYNNRKASAIRQAKKFFWEEFNDAKADTSCLDYFMQLEMHNLKEELIQHKLCEICRYRYKTGRYRLTLEFIPFKSIPSRYKHSAADRIDNFVPIETCDECRMLNIVALFVKRDTLFRAGYYDWMEQMRYREGYLKKLATEEFIKAWRFHPERHDMTNSIKSREIGLYFPVDSYQEKELTYKKCGFTSDFILIPESGIVTEKIKKACEFTLDLILRT